MFGYGKTGVVWLPDGDNSLRLRQVNSFFDTRKQKASPPRGNAIPAGPLIDFTQEAQLSQRGHTMPRVVEYFG